MDELVKQIVSKTGISEEQARSAADTVVGFLKARLPESLAGHVDSVLGSAAGAIGGLDIGSVTSSLGGLFGKK